MFYAIYKKNTGKIIKSISMPTSFTELIQLKEGEGFVAIPRLARDGAECIKNGELVELPPINNPNIPYDDVSVWDEVAGEWQPDDALIAAKKERDQAEMWERIKATRLAKVTSGVYIPSIDKYVHTDADTGAMYAQIGSSILLGTFEEMNWKAMDNSFFNMTESVFKEIQTEMMRQTQRYHAKAEYHKVMLLAANDPLEYNYHDDW